MFSGVRRAILPLAVRRSRRRDDLERASLLIESLALHWRDRRPLELLIVSPARDVELLRSSLPRAANLSIEVRPEGDFFAPFSAFYLMTGWFRQQVIKLHVPARLGFAGYLTLDSDVVCVGDFDAGTFVRDGRAVSRWEPKSGQDWWRNVAALVGVPYAGQSHGLSVTPNILHGDLAAQALAHVARGAGDATSQLWLWCVRGIPAVAWTEYSLYTTVAELNGNLLAYHQDWDTCYGGDVHLFSERSCVWKADDFTRLAGLPRGSDPGGKFVVVQSNAQIPVERVRTYIQQFAG